MREASGEDEQAPTHLQDVNTHYHTNNTSQINEILPSQGGEESLHPSRQSVDDVRKQLAGGASIISNDAHLPSQMLQRRLKKSFIDSRSNGIAMSSLIETIIEEGEEEDEEEDDGGLEELKEEEEEEEEEEVVTIVPEVKENSR